MRVKFFFGFFPVFFKQYWATGQPDGDFDGDQDYVRISAGATWNASGGVCSCKRQSQEVGQSIAKLSECLTANAILHWLCKAM